MLREAEKKGELTVVIARDRTVRRVKGKSPVQDERERCAIVQRYVPTARVMLGDENDYLAPIRTVRPELIVLGYDQGLPPGVRAEDLPCPVERLSAFEPQRYKSSLRNS